MDNIPKGIYTRYGQKLGRVLLTSRHTQRGHAHGRYLHMKDIYGRDIRAKGTYTRRDTHTEEHIYGKDIHTEVISQEGRDTLGRT